MVTCYEHFESVASEYRQLRTTDDAPIEVIHRFLDHGDKLNVADIGCGTGRYSQLLAHQLGPAINKIFCVDVNHAMLGELSSALPPVRMSNFELIRASASDLPFCDSTIDVITSFNAIHHFDLPRFLTESGRVLKEGGTAFLYTRLKDQNGATIWGRFFPGFHVIETRLYDASELVDLIDRHFRAAQLRVTAFSFPRQSSLETLLEQARRHHYSTFHLYDRDEFDYALGEFEGTIRQVYRDPGAVCWTDSYTLFSLTNQYRGR